MGENFDARQTETELDILTDQLECVQEGREVDSRGHDITMTEEQIERAMRTLLNESDDETYPEVSDEELFG